MINARGPLGASPFALVNRARLKRAGMTALPLLCRPV
jgi:hypothetical protein